MTYSKDASHSIHTDIKLNSFACFSVAQFILIDLRPKQACEIASWL